MHYLEHDGRKYMTDSGIETNPILTNVCWSLNFGPSKVLQDTLAHLTFQPVLQLFLSFTDQETLMKFSGFFDLLKLVTISNFSAHISAFFSIIFDGQRKMCFIKKEKPQV